MVSLERQEFLPRPELIQGSPFRHSIILPTREGRFELAGLAVPLGWQKAENLPRDSSRMEEYLSLLLKENYLENPCRVVVDQQTGLLIRVTVGTEPPSFFHLSGLPGGEYDSSFSDLKAAIAVQYFASSCLNSILHAIGDRRLFSCIAGGPGHYGPADLELPWRFDWEIPEKPVTTREEQEKFFHQAQVLVGKFGLQLFPLLFNTTGILTDIEVRPGDRTTYHLDGVKYGEHNVNTPEKAAALQAVVATFVNYLWEKLEAATQTFK